MVYQHRWLLRRRDLYAVIGAAKAAGLGHRREAVAAGCRFRRCGMARAWPPRRGHPGVVVVARPGSHAGAAGPTATAFGDASRPWKWPAERRRFICCRFGGRSSLACRPGYRAGRYSTGSLGEVGASRCTWRSSMSPATSWDHLESLFGRIRGCSVRLSVDRRRPGRTGQRPPNVEQGEGHGGVGVRGRAGDPGKEANFGRDAADATSTRP